MNVKMKMKMKMKRMVVMMRMMVLGSVAECVEFLKSKRSFSTAKAFAVSTSFLALRALKELELLDLGEVGIDDSMSLG